MNQNSINKVKEYIKEEHEKDKDLYFTYVKKYDSINNEEFKKIKENIETKYKIQLPEDYCEFLILSNGYPFENETELVPFEKVDEYTEYFRDLMDNFSNINNVDNHIAIGMFNGDYFYLYLNECKRYIKTPYIEDFNESYTLDGKDIKIVNFSSIWEIFVYENEEKFKEEYEELFGEYNTEGYRKKINEEVEFSFQSEKERENEYKKQIQEGIKNGDILEINIKIDEEYLKLFDEYQKLKYINTGRTFLATLSNIGMHSYTGVKYCVGEEFKLYIKLKTNKFDVSTPSYKYNKALDFSIASIIDHKDHYEIISKEDSLEPFIIYKKILNNATKKAIENKIHKKQNNYIDNEIIIKNSKL